MPFPILNLAARHLALAALLAWAISGIAGAAFADGMPRDRMPADTAADTVAGAPPSADSAQFLSVLDDVPLMPGLVEAVQAGVDFETPSGRLVKAEAVGQPDAGLSVSSVRAFYGEALVALGWEKIGRDRFRRSGEVLSLDISEAADGYPAVRVRYTLAPQ